VHGRGRDSAPASGLWIKIIEPRSQITLPDLRSKNALANLVQGDEHPDQELLVLSLQGKGKPVDDAPQDLQQLTNPVKVLRLVNKPKQA
jgi:hypothetical protein